MSFQVAVSLGTPIMSEEWVHKTWEYRDEFSMQATDDSLLAYRMSPFFFSTLSFLGFTKEEQRHMEELTIENGEHTFTSSFTHNKDSLFIKNVSKY